MTVHESLFADLPDHGFVTREDDTNLATSETPYSQAVECEEFERLKSALAKLSRKHKNVLTKYYGLEGQEESLSEIGNSYGVTKQCVGQWKNWAERQLLRDYQTSKGNQINET